MRKPQTAMNRRKGHDWLFILHYNFIHGIPLLGVIIYASDTEMTTVIQINIAYVDFRDNSGKDF